jgi:sporulation protein YabP
MENTNTLKHRLDIDQRRECKISGVAEVRSFDENVILLETVDGMLTIKGNGMHVSRLNLERGEADVEGRVDSFAYSEKNPLAKKGEGLIARLFG